MKIAMMMAMDLNHLIGAGGGMPWKIASELQYFKNTTMGKPMVMGRVTWDSIGRPLPGRPSIVVTRDTSFSAVGAIVTRSLCEAFDQARQFDADELVVVGGASLCKAAMPFTERLYLTVIEYEFEGGDTWLDSYQPAHWQEISRRQMDESADGGHRYHCLVLDRKDQPQSTA